MKNQDLQNRINWLMQEKYGGLKTKASKKDIERLKAGEPLDYIIGSMKFLGCDINLSKKTLIPRVETEFWVDEAVRNLPRETLEVLDVFSGSGCIGIAILKNLQESHVTFADQQKNSLEQIKINCDLNKISKAKYKIVKSDIFSNIKGKFDYIFANPPYIPESRKSKVQKSVLRYEPKEALFGGKDGLFYINKFLAAAKKFLKSDGKIYMEFDSIQKKSLEKLIKRYDYKSFTVNKDQYGKWRYAVIK